MAAPLRQLITLIWPSEQPTTTLRSRGSHTMQVIVESTRLLKVVSVSPVKPFKICAGV